MGLDQILHSLFAAGPLAGVLGLTCYVLWKQYQKERELHEQETQKERDRHSSEEEKLRSQLEDLTKEYVHTLKGLTKALRDQSEEETPS